MKAEDSKPVKRSAWLRVTWQALRLLLIGYLGVVLVMMFLENKLVYHPVRASEDWQNPPSGANWQDVELTTTDGIKIHAWWCPVSGAESALLFCHGNAGNLSHRIEAIEKWQRELGVSVLIFDYPGYGKSAGSPSEPACYAAGEAAYRWLTDTQHVPPDNILLFGGSIGGGIATELAVRHRCQALILANTFTSLPEVGQRLYPWLPVRLVMRNRYNNLAKLPQVQSPVIITHGRLDSLVPFAHAERLYEAAREPKLFHPVAASDHNTPLSVEFYRAVQQFLADQQKQK